MPIARFVLPLILPAALPAAPASVAKGKYECWANGQARLLLNFSIDSASAYTDSDSKKGSFTYDPASGRIAFKGGMLEDAMPKGFYSVYEVRGKTPTVSFRSPRGSEASFCELTR
jgi:hypothetical protein